MPLVRVPGSPAAVVATVVQVSVRKLERINRVLTGGPERPASQTNQENHHLPPPGEPGIQTGRQQHVNSATARLKISA